MNNRPLVWSGTLALIIFSLFLLVSTDKLANTAATTNTISFSGEGRILAKPDIAKINFSIVTEAKTSKEAQAANSPKSKAITDFLKEQGIADKDIKTTGYNIYPKYSYSTRPCPLEASPSYPCEGRQTISGYTVDQSFELKIRNLDQASEIVDGLVTAGANNISQLNFAIDNPDQLKEEARVLAITKAKEKAKNLEKQIGLKLGKIINFQENTGNYPYSLYDKSFEVSGLGGGLEGPSLPVGENEIVINISLTYQIK